MLSEGPRITSFRVGFAPQSRLFLDLIPAGAAFGQFPSFGGGPIADGVMTGGRPPRGRGVVPAAVGVGVGVGVCGGVGVGVGVGVGLTSVGVGDVVGPPAQSLLFTKAASDALSFAQSA